MTRLALAALIAVLAAGCGGDDDAAAPAPPAPPPAPSAAAAQGRLSARPQPVEDAGEAGERRIGGAMLYVSPGDGPKTLVVGLHGAGSNPEEPMALLRPHADRAGLILLAPKSQGATWDVAQGGFGPDVEAIDGLLAQIFSEYDIDDVAVAGFSDGASYALSLGLTNGDLFDHVIGFSPASSRSSSRTGNRACSSLTARRTRSCRSAGRAGEASRSCAQPVTRSATASSTATTRCPTASPARLSPGSRSSACRVLSRPSRRRARVRERGNGDPDQRGGDEHRLATPTTPKRRPRAGDSTCVSASTGGRAFRRSPGLRPVDSGTRTRTRRRCVADRAPWPWP